MNKIYLTMDNVQAAARELAANIEESVGKVDTIYGVPRGGIAAAYLVASHIPGSSVVFYPDDADIIVDDLIDSGATRQRHACYNLPFFSLYDKRVDAKDSWLVFPWEQSGKDISAEDIPVRLLQYIGEDPSRGGLQETPQRFLKAWDHWASGYKQDPAQVLKVFEDGAERYDELVLVKDLPVYSHCEHHLAPFFGVAHVAYIPFGKIVGLSKLGRLVDIFARRLQVQERMTNQIADALQETLNPIGVGVVLECRHLCMESRGIQRQGATTTTSALRGVLHDEPAARAEFLTLIKG